MIVWPSTLPQYPTKDYSESGGSIIRESNPTLGVSKKRYLGKKPSVLQVSYEMTTEQLALFETFVNNVLFGVKRFTIMHPRKQTSVEVRLVSQSELYQLVRLANSLWKVSFSVEILP